jgi:hypothetical protein
MLNVLCHFDVHKWTKITIYRKLVRGVVVAEDVVTQCERCGKSKNDIWVK